MSLVLESVKVTANRYWINEKRFYYTTPKSYLASIALYTELLSVKTKETQQSIQRLENGLVKLSQCAEMVEHLKVIYLTYVEKIAPSNNVTENAMRARDNYGREALSRRSANCCCRW